LEYGDDSSGFEYDYTIYKEAFMDEGVYSIILYSRDTLGNEACTQFAFIIDNTPPCVVADGIGEEGLLPEEGSKVNVYVNDNFKLDEAYFNVVNGRGEVIECYDYIRFAENEWDVMTITVPSGEAPLSLMYNVKDAAGNGIRTIYEDKVPMSDSTTRYDYIIDDSQKLSPWFGAALCLVVALFLVCFFIFIKFNFHLKSLYKCIIVDIVK
jgi:hypothetical protein